MTFRYTRWPSSWAPDYDAIAIFRRDWLISPPYTHSITFTNALKVAAAYDTRLRVEAATLRHAYLLATYPTFSAPSLA